MTNTILELDKVSYHYNQPSGVLDILKDVSYKFEKGKLYAITGPSGSGKSTAISLLAGLDNPKEGKIIYNEKDLKKIGLNNYRKNNVEIVFQSHNLLTYMSALDNILSAMKIAMVKKDKPKEYVLSVLESLKIDNNMATRSVKKLSGGQMQRVAIARAITCNGDIIIADEPTGNLDKKTASEIIEIFKKIAYVDNKCVIVVTHSQALAKNADVRLELDNYKFNEK